MYWITSGAIVECAIGGCGGNLTTVVTSNAVSAQDPSLAVEATLMKIAK